MYKVKLILSFVTTIFKADTIMASKVYLNSRWNIIGITIKVRSKIKSLLSGLAKGLIIITILLLLIVVNSYF